MMIQKKPLRVSQIIAAVAVLAPIAVLLSAPGAPRIPYPPLPYLTFEAWEIPVYFAFTYFGFRTALLVELVVYLVTQTVPGPVLFGPLYSVAAVLLTLGGLYFGSKVSFGRRRIALAVFLAALMRVVGMTLVNYVGLQLPLPFGFNYPLSVVLPVLVPTAVFNLIVALYSTLAGITLSSAISRRLGAAPDGA
jgi:riboflavin transporter FmnP